MRVRSWIIVLFVSLLSVSLSAGQPGAKPQSSLHWIPWSDAAFAQARSQHKFVLLDLEAVWCHWCHVMDEVTYKDPNVVHLLQAKYVLVKVDQDSRPDISNRYQDYGWPATVVFNAEGGEIVKRQGYMPPEQMASMLQAIIDDPSPGPSIEKERPVQFAKSTVLSDDMLSQIRKLYDGQYDQPVGGWGFVHKYLDADSVEYAMRLAAAGDGLYAKRSRETLNDARKLIDPIWGGAYQYSVTGWDEPHYEKLILIQSQFIREYSLAYAQWHEVDDARVAQSVHFYVHSFLTDPESGAFYVSQDADLKDGLEENAPYFKLDDRGRRAQGIPRIDKHIYARENGWMIAALAQLYADTGDRTALSEAERAAEWILLHRALSGGGFRHDEHDVSGPYLGDSLAMGQALLALYAVTCERRWLDSAEQTRRFIETNFAPLGRGGYITSVVRTDRAYAQHPDHDENIALARFANLLYRYSGRLEDHATAERAMLYVAAKDVALQPLSAGVLLAEDESTHEPLHIAVVGRHDDGAAAALFDTALRSLNSYERLEWRDPTDKRPVQTDVAYPPLTRAAAFLCTARACSSPVYQPKELAAKLMKAASSGR